MQLFFKKKNSSPNRRADPSPITYFQAQKVISLLQVVILVR